MQLSKILTSLFLTTTLAACTAATADKINKAVNPMADPTRLPRQAGIDRLAKAVCETYAEHHAFAKGEKYATADECVADYKTTFANKYPTESCAEPHAFDTTKFVQCETRAKNWQGSSNVFDLAGFMTSCTAASVCK